MGCTCKVLTAWMLSDEDMIVKLSHSNQNAESFSDSRWALHMLPVKSYINAECHVCCHRRLHADIYQGM